MSKVMLFPADKSVEQGDIIKCLLDTNISPGKGKLGYCYDSAWFDLKRSCWQAQHLYIVEHSDLSVGDWCMFYDSPSKVLEINGGTAKIESITIVSEDDAEFINRIQGKVVSKAGDFGRMVHSFSMKSLPKVIASTDKTLSLVPLPSNFVKMYIFAYNQNTPFTDVEMILRYDLCRMQNLWTIITNPVKQKVFKPRGKKKLKTQGFVVEYHSGDGNWKVFKKYNIQGWRDLAIKKLTRKAEVLQMYKGYEYRAVNK